MRTVHTHSTVGPSLAAMALALTCVECEGVLGADFDDYERAFGVDGATDVTTDRRDTGGTTGAGGAVTTGGAAGTGSMTAGTGGHGTGGAAGSGSGGNSSGGSSVDAGGRDGTTVPPSDADLDGHAADAGSGMPPDVDVDSGPPPPRDGGTSGGTCTPGQVNPIAACGNCGTYLQTCNAQGVWDPPFCQQEPAACAPGSTEHRSCDDNGTQLATCTSGCTWSVGECVHPICTSGQIESQPCSMCGTQTRTCQGGDGGGKWGPFSACAGQGSCAPGTSDVTTCGNCGTHTRTCTSSCAWDAWGACQGEGACAPGEVQTEACLLLLTRTRACTADCQWGPWGSCL